MYIPKPSETTFALTPAGTHLATCYRVIDLGTQEVLWQGQKKLQHKIMLSWELPNELMEGGEHDGQPYSMHQRYTFSMSEKATLRHHLEAWRGKPFEEADFGSFHMSKLLGKGCFLNVLHATKDGKTYANIGAVMALPKGQKAAPLINKSVMFSLAEFNEDVFNELSEGLRGIIAKSPEYAAIMARRNMSEEPPPPKSADDFGQEIPF